MASLESGYQATLIKRLRKILPGCVIQKLDEQYQQGIPDLLILFRDQWAILEVKKSESEPYQPNQEWFIDKFNAMSFAAMICPQNEEEVLRDLQQALRPGG